MRLIVSLKQCLSLVVLVGFMLEIGGCAPEATKPGSGSVAPARGAALPPLPKQSTEQAGSEEDLGAEPVAPEETEEGAGQ